MFTGNEKDLTKPLVREMTRFGKDFIDREGDAKNRVVARETAIAAVIDAFVRKIHRREQTHGPSEILQGERARGLGHRLQRRVGFWRDQLLKSPNEWRFFERQIVEYLGK